MLKHLWGEELKMKNLNRRGFTLIELLAVIVILAIVLVVTIPSVINSINTARTKSLQNAADSVATWFTKQYELNELGADGVSENFKALDFTDKTSVSSSITITDALLKEAGLGGGTTDATGKVWKSGNRMCVKLTGKSAGNFATTTSKTSSGC